MGLAAIAVYALTPTGQGRTAVFAATSTIAILVAVAAIARSRATPRAPWLLIAFGHILFVAADVGPAELEAVGDLSAIAGLLLLIRRRMAGRKGGGLIDAAIVTTAVAVSSWSYVLRPLAMRSDLDPLSTGQSLGYPSADLLLMGTALALLTTPGARSAALVLLGSSLTLVFAEDQLAAIQLLGGGGPDGTAVDGLHLFASILFAAATLHPSMRHLTDRQPPVSNWLGRARFAGLAMAMITGPVLFLVGPVESRTSVAIATATMSLLALLRLAGLVRLLEHDVAGRRVLEAKLTHQALHDPVTGLANRRRFVAEAEAALAARRRPGSIAALFIDLDDFKSINDDLGHAAGDEALVLVAERITSVMRDGDLAARLGGDEFGVLVLGLTAPEEARAVGDRILSALAEPLQLRSGPVVVGASIGTAIDGPGPGGVDELLGMADMAMYRAKGLARGGHQVSADAPAGAHIPSKRSTRLVRAHELVTEPVA